MRLKKTLNLLLNSISLKHLLFTFFLFFIFFAKSGTIDTVTIQSNTLKKETKVLVISPTNSANKKESYPVVYLLHGYGGDYKQWNNVAPQLQYQADLHKIIFVCPDGGKGSWYFDSPIDSTIRYESYITKELVPYIDLHFSTQAKASSRAITGLSMGGHGAMYLAIRHGDLFGAAGSSSGGVDFTPFPKKWDISKALGDYLLNKERWQQNTVLYQVNTLKNDQLAIIIDCGVDDFFIDVNRSLHQRLLELKINHEYTERPGGHTSTYWKENIDFQILFFKKFFSKS
jgi:S-formylglutathione hydrolase FrmB